MRMKKKHEELVHIIRQQKQPISSTQLARLLNVTPRSVKNYIAAIQEEFPNLIAAGPRGYRIDTDTDVNTDHDIPQTYRERSAYIIRQFLLIMWRRSTSMIFVMSCFLAIPLSKDF